VCVASEFNIFFLPAYLLGLVNGAQGVVKKVWCHPGSNVRTHLPAVVFVKFDGYSGMTF
jgi:hypothetical protein